MDDFGIGEIIEETVEKYKKKVRSAVKRVEPIAKRKIETTILPKVIHEYYTGYWPKSYRREYQLYKSLGPFAEYRDSNDYISLTIGLEDESPYGSGAMSHSGKNADEQQIFDNFKKGIHPNVPTLGDELQGTHTTEYTLSLIDELIETELMPMIDQMI